MKSGKTLMELAAEIERQRDNRKDYLADTKALVMTEEADLVLQNGKRDLYPLNNLAHGQVASWAGIPKTYYDTMLEKAPALLSRNVNHWFEATPAQRLVRTLDGKVRAWLSDSYRPLENADLAEAVLPVLLSLKVEIMSCEITDRRFYIKAVDERIKTDVPSGRKIGDGSHVFFDTVSPAITISNSEVGFGALTVESGIFTKVCTNLATFADAGMRRRHLGARNDLTDGEQIRHLLSDETKRATDRAIWMQLTDVVKGAFAEAQFAARTDRLKGLAEQPIKGDPIKCVELSARKLGMLEDEKGSVLRHLIEGGDLTRYGLFNAITRTAQDLSSYDRASEFEKLGGQVIDLPRSAWTELAEAA